LDFGRWHGRRGGERGWRRLRSVGRCRHCIAWRIALRTARAQRRRDRQRAGQQHEGALHWKVQRTTLVLSIACILESTTKPCTHSTIPCSAGFAGTVKRCEALTPSWFSSKPATPAAV